MRLRRKVLWIVFTLAALIVLPAFVYYVIYDHQNAPLCHKAVLLGCLDYFDAQKTDVLPNVNGHSSDSIALMHKYWGDDPGWEEKYRYVPGLKKGDSGDLVLMYMAAPTRYIFHGNPQTIFADKKWILIPLDFCWHATEMGVTKADRDMPSTGEECERVSLDELRSRVTKTLAFLREHNSPNWQTVSDEHEAFLKSAESQR